MFVAHASDLISNPVFALKLFLVGLAGVNAALFHAGVFRRAGSWDIDVPPPLTARAAGAASLLVWISVIACGRLLAYT
jgi:hypothetical protein